MSFVDSLDSVLMLYAYASPSPSTPEGKIGLFQSTKIELDEEADRGVALGDATSESRNDDLILSEELAPKATTDGKNQVTNDVAVVPTLAQNEGNLGESTSGPNIQAIDQKTQVISSLSVTLTVLSIVVALR